jgi:undecaprenyl-diphosphatase
MGNCLCVAVERDRAAEALGGGLYWSEGSRRGLQDLHQGDGLEKPRTGIGAASICLRREGSQALHLREFIVCVCDLSRLPRETGIGERSLAQLIAQLKKAPFTRRDLQHGCRRRRRRDVCSGGKGQGGSTQNQSRQRAYHGRECDRGSDICQDSGQNGYSWNMSDRENIGSNVTQAAGLVGGHLILGGASSLLSSGLFAALWRSVKDDSQDTTMLDRAAALWMHDHQRPGLTELARGLAVMGSPPVMIGVGAAGALSGLLLRRVRGAAWTLPLAILGAGAIIQGVKTIFRRPRPSFFTPLLKETGYSFPSGHSLIAMTVYGLLGFFGMHLVRGRSARAAMVGGAGTVIGLVGASRVYVGVHYITDVLAGWTAGFPWLLTCIVLHEHLARRFAVAGQPVLSEDNSSESLSRK